GRGDNGTARWRDAEAAGRRGVETVGRREGWMGRGDHGPARGRDGDASGHEDGAALWAARTGSGSSDSRGRREAPESTTSFFYDGVAAGREVRAGLSRRPAATRPLPMEDLCFFVKTIDNSRLVRVVDPHSRRECLGLIASVTAVFFLALL